MIRVRKSESVPESLIKTKAYDGEDVKQQLLVDQDKKCYICERRIPIDFVIEHRNSQHSFGDQRQDWQNLYLSCPYCNGKKLSLFDGMLDPHTINVEIEIQQRIDFGEKRVILTPGIASDAHALTAALLDRVFNGSGRIRRIKEEMFFERFLSQINRFMDHVTTFLISHSEETRMVVLEDLSVTQEFLGFKYWIIKDHPVLNSEFSDAVVWNKVEAAS